ncbi:hypothetical protein [Actinocorallia libanotica]|uniref:Uncharacterized protein n=1 Tax=Actinocorallia libanotica TaxID=46162 RepID=A0ABN1Q0C1_9ACTN
MSTRTKPQIHALAQRRALGYLQREHRADYERYRIAAESRAGGTAEGNCLNHEKLWCPLPKGEHRTAYQKAKNAARYAALSRLRDEHYAVYREAYDGEVEYLLEGGEADAA